MQTYHTAPPMLFDDLYRSVLPEELKKPVDHLLYLKISGSEKTEIAPIEEIDSFLHARITETDRYLACVHDVHGARWENINRFFYDEITDRQ